MTNDLIPANFWRFPMMPFSSIMDEMEDLMPTSNLFNGLAVSEDEKNVYIEAAVPGVEGKDIDVTFNKGVLSVKAEKKEEEKGKTYHRRANRSFLYRVVLRDVDQKAEPQARYKNGIMTVTFVKEASAKPKKIAVKTA